MELPSGGRNQSGGRKSHTFSDYFVSLSQARLVIIFLWVIMAVMAEVVAA